MRRTFKEDRKLAIKLAEKLGHEIGAWRWWDGQKQGLASCKLCGCWIGVSSDNRDWVYDPDDEDMYESSSGIKGTAIFGFGFTQTTERCSGVKYRATQRMIWTKEYKRILNIINANSPEDAAKLICGTRI